MGQSYAGDIMPEEAQRVLAENPEAVLVDVRTAGEWRQVGVPDLSGLGKDVVLLPWILQAGGPPNPDFVASLTRQVADKATPLLFLCRVGGRSRAAAIAMTAAGYSRCYNVAEGYEGTGGRTGWKPKGLPWSPG
ncbi:MAG TPA: rhodanese-like domain-containing protein [Kiloniellales bacterium]|nr:rhodanese-like domain-containing protein [Kiloniellales bacterium]